MNFFLYHAQFHPELTSKVREKGEVPLYMLIWLEGLATYASRRNLKLIKMENK